MVLPNLQFRNTQQTNLVLALIDLSEEDQKHQY